MIPTFKRVVRRSYHIYTHDETDDVLDYLTMPALERGAIAKISRGTGIQFQTLRDWRQLRATDPDRFPLANGHPKARAFDPIIGSCHPGFRPRQSHPTWNRRQADRLKALVPRLLRGTRR
jgi:hypothetical protein